MNIYDLHHLSTQERSFSYFYKKEKRDANGNARFRVWVIDPQGGQIYERIFKQYESLLSESILNFIKTEVLK